jgi:hypothetical protein
MDIIHAVDQARRVVKVGELGLAIRAGLQVDDVNGGAGGAEIDLLAPGLHVVLGVLAVHHEVAPGLGQGVLHQTTRDQESALVGQGRTRIGEQLDAGGNGVAEADLLQHVEGGAMDALDLGVAERLVIAAFHAGLDRAFLLRNGCRAQLAPGVAPAAPPLGGFRFVHQLDSSSAEPRRGGSINPR